MNHNIRLLILDIDGVMTDGKLTFNAQGEEIKSFHAHDGYGLKQLMDAGVPVAVISGRSSDALKHRLKELNIEHTYLKIKDKMPMLLDVSKKLDVPLTHIAYVGDDLPDKDPMIAVAYPIAVANAQQAIKDIAAWTTTKTGGNGAVREVCDWILNYE